MVIVWGMIKRRGLNLRIGHQALETKRSRRGNLGDVSFVLRFSEIGSEGGVDFVLIFTHKLPDGLQLCQPPLQAPSSPTPTTSPQVAHNSASIKHRFFIRRAHSSHSQQPSPTLTKHLLCSKISNLGTTVTTTTTSKQTNKTLLEEANKEKLRSYFLEDATA